MGLAITKNLGESFSLDGTGHTKVTIIRVRGDKVTVNIEAPKSVYIARDAEKPVDRFDPDCETVVRK